MEKELLFLLGLGIGVSIGFGLFLASKSTPASEFLYPSSSKPTVHNKEIWEWVDWRGKKRRIEVSRVVERSR